MSRAIRAHHPIFFLSLSKRERTKVRDCSLIAFEDELSRAPLQLTCVVDDQRQTDHRSDRYSGAGGETWSHPGRIRADQENSRSRTKFYRARNLFGDVE